MNTSSNPSSRWLDENHIKGLLAQDADFAWAPVKAALEAEMTEAIGLRVFRR